MLARGSRLAEDFRGGKSDLGRPLGGGGLRSHGVEKRGFKKAGLEGPSVHEDALRSAVTTTQLIIRQFICLSLSATSFFCLLRLSL